MIRPTTAGHVLKFYNHLYSWEPNKSDMTEIVKFLSLYALINSNFLIVTRRYIQFSFNRINFRITLEERL